VVPLLQTVTPLPGAYEPFPQPSYPPASVDKLPELPKTLPHVLHLVSSLPLLLHLLVRAQVQVHVYTEAEVKKGRQRLGGGKSEKEVRKTVDGDVLSGSLGAELLELLREVGGHPNVDDSIRREVEIKEFGFWRRLVTVLP
jgi:superkiller protein 3